ncbi:MAG TPA: monooxygenase [Gammaproteobacteria bacterium]|nr:monooxygenase [Gammaproteobacteria bacterium]|tara:strand:- start:9001 stop:10803 length:1803 start_codon:yes stop_codon:yes gene_type:complete
MALPTKDELGFDPDALREKYRTERDKRLRTDANEQYQEIKGEYAAFLADPYIAHPTSRSPLTDDVEIAIIGGGFGGLIAGARLKELGFEDIRLIEKGGDFGGTWYWNRYPGAACDTEAYIYLPLLEELDYVPSQKYAHAPEILSHSQNIAKKYNLYENACLETEVTALNWDENASRWIIQTNRKDKFRARFVIMSNGPLHRPKLPGIQGINSFQGHTFHTSRWDYRYTGGDSNGGLNGLKNKRVAIIGTGATAVQCTPHVGEKAKQLYVFQRTPSSIDIRANRKTDPQWASQLKPGWQKERMENFNILCSGGVVEEDLVKDGWTEIIRNLISMANYRGENTNWDEVPKLMEIADFQKMEQIRNRAAELVNDPKTAESLKPYYRQFCKRPCFHDSYLQTFNRPSVELVDTKGKGVERITENGVIADGKEYEVDCIIFATGFEVGTSYVRRSGYDVTGTHGITLSEKWADGMRTLHGVMTNGFPNLFIISNSQAGFTTNFPHAMDETSQHIGYMLKQCEKEQLSAIEASKESEDKWVEEIIAVSRFASDFQESCTPGYYNNEGEPNPKSVQNGPYGKGSRPYFRITAAWREEGNMSGILKRP